PPRGAPPTSSRCRSGPSSGSSPSASSASRSLSSAIWDASCAPGAIVSRNWTSGEVAAAQSLLRPPSQGDTSVSPTVVAIVGIVILLGILFLRLPVSFAMLAVGFGGAVVLSGQDSALQLLASDLYRQFSSYPMAVVPLFILMGPVLLRTGMDPKVVAAAST